ncbi:MAG: sigma-70 family RNA polymerase sigma factor [Caldilineaceae bacterium]
MTDLTMLVSAAQHGDQSAFGQIVVRFQDMAYASAYAVVGDSTLAQDVTQEAFLEAWINLAKLREPAAFPGWFRRIVLGNGHRHTRAKTLSTVPLDRAEGLYTAALNHDSVTNWTVQQELGEAIATLNEAQRLVLALFYVEGYSYKEIAAYLETPVSTVKKRLFDGRKQLHERMIPMVKQTLQANKPSQEPEFANKVQFFIALRDHSLTQIKKLLAQQPSLLEAKTEWKMALGHHYWPIGSTAIHLSAASGDAEILAYLLDQGSEIDKPNHYGMTALHMATMMRQPATVELLLRRGAALNATSPMGQTPLHLAALREYGELVQLLLEKGADRNLRDKSGRSPSDWARIHYNPEVAHYLGVAAKQEEEKAIATLHSPLRKQWLGRIVDGRGNALDGGLALAIPKRNQQTVPPQTSALQLPTGIKIIDLLAPLPRGGQVGVFTPLSGVGLVTLLGELIYSFYKLHSGVTILLVMENDLLRAADQTLYWRESGVDDKMVFVAGKRNDSPAQLRQTVESALAVAESMRKEGIEILLIVDSQFAAVEGMADLLQNHADPGITTLYHGNHTVGVVPEVFSHLDAVVTFDYSRAKARLFPAIDPVRSTSRLLQRDALAPEPRRVADQVRRLLQRYSDLRQPMEEYRMTVNDLWYIDDDPNLAQEIPRARKLDRFLTHSFYGAEPWTGAVGQLIEVSKTVAGCQAILDGAMDQTPEEAFYFVGDLAEVKQKAQAMKQ